MKTMKTMVIMETDYERKQFRECWDAIMAEKAKGARNPRAGHSISSATVMAVEIDDFDNGKYIAKSEGECRDMIDAMVFARVKETGVAVAQGCVSGRPIFA